MSTPNANRVIITLPLTMAPTNLIPCPNQESGTGLRNVTENNPDTHRQRQREAITPFPGRSAPSLRSAPSEQSADAARSSSPQIWASDKQLLQTSPATDDITDRLLLVTAPRKNWRKHLSLQTYGSFTFSCVERMMAMMAASAAKNKAEDKENMSRKGTHHIRCRSHATEGEIIQRVPGELRPAPWKWQRKWCQSVSQLWWTRWKQRHPIPKWERNLVQIRLHPYKEEINPSLPTGTDGTPISAGTGNYKTELATVRKSRQPGHLNGGYTALTQIR